MTIEIRPEQEQLIGRAIEAGLISSPSEVLDVGVETIRRQLEAEPIAGYTMSADEWSRELHAWISSHRTDTPLLSDEAVSRDSIYGNRGM